MKNQLSIWHNNQWMFAALDPKAGMRKSNGAVYYRMQYPFRIYEDWRVTHYLEEGSITPLQFTGEGRLGDYIVVDPAGEMVAKTEAWVNKLYPAPLSPDSRRQLFGDSPPLNSRSIQQDPNLLTEIARELTGRRSDRTSRAVPTTSRPTTTGGTSY